ncbi:hypothetical protein CPC08DRAFT_728007 [Agrocybe pediades]|nr:hypothetical protein CPC08DRAFT_728007 [Agrocybe pediades]
MSPVPVLPGRRNHGLPDYAWGFGVSMDGNREKMVTLWMVAVGERIHLHHVVELRAGSPCLEWFVLDRKKPTLHTYDLTLSILEGRNFISWKIPARSFSFKISIDGGTRQTDVPLRAYQSFGLRI